MCRRFNPGPDHFAGFRLASPQLPRRKAFLFPGFFPAASLASPPLAKSRPPRPPVLCAKRCAWRCALSPLSSPRGSVPVARNSLSSHPASSSAVRPLEARYGSRIGSVAPGPAANTQAVGCNLVAACVSEKPQAFQKTRRGSSAAPHETKKDFRALRNARERLPVAGGKSSGERLDLFELPAVPLELHGLPPWTCIGVPQRTTAVVRSRPPLHSRRPTPARSRGFRRDQHRCDMNDCHLPSIFIMMKMTTAPKNPPPANR